MDTYCKGKWELVEGKGVSFKIKGALIRGGKGKGHFNKIIGALVKVKGELFLCKKGALFGYLNKWVGTVPHLPPGSAASGDGSYTLV